MHPVYIEISDEVTTVIERIKGQSDAALALIVPKGAILLQSIVNLKLVKKAAEDGKKEIVLITTDKIGRNLADQIGIATYAKFDPNQVSGDTGSEDPSSEEHAKVIAGVKIHRYYDDEGEEAEETEEVEPIIPKTILQTAPADTAGSQTGRQEVAALEAREAQERRGERADAGATEAAETEEIIEEAAVEAEAVEAEAARSTDKQSNPIKPKGTGETGITRTILDPDTDKPAHPALVRHADQTHHLRRIRKVAGYTAFLFFLAVVAAAALSFVYLPQTTVAIHVPSEAWEREFQVTALGGLSSPGEEGQEVPAVILTTETSKSVDFPATGSKDIGETAKGTAKIFNGYSSTPQTLPAGARISANGLVFLTDSAVTVPGARVEGGQPVAGSIEVAVTAEKSGPESNLTNATGSILSPASNTYAQIVSTTGGSSRQVKVVTQSDIASAKNQLTKQLQEETTGALNTQAKGRDLLVPEQPDEFALTDFTSSVQAGSEADTGKVSGKGTATRLAVERDQVYSAILARVQKEIAGDKKAAMRSFTPVKVEAAAAEQRVTVTAATQGILHLEVSSERIRGQLPGKRQPEVRQLIEAAVPGAKVDIEQNPSWWPLKSIPTANRYLKVNVTYE
jgi:hypothetical protein